MRGSNSYGYGGTMNGKNNSNEVENLLKALIIVQLGLAGVPQTNIRKIVGGDINRINEILKNVKPKQNTKH